MHGARASPLRLPWRRARLWAIAFAGIGLAPIVATPFYGFHDWTAFWTAGHLVGSPAIVSAAATIEWQQARALPLAIFPYPPPAALLLWPFAQLPVDVSFWLHAAGQLACGIAAAVLGARVYELPRGVAVLGALAWAPLTAAVVIGQNTPFALLLAMAALTSLVAGRDSGPGAAMGAGGGAGSDLGRGAGRAAPPGPERASGPAAGQGAERFPGARLAAGVGRGAVAGMAAGALLYKPTIGVPLAGLFLLRRAWTAVAVVAAIAVGWYLVGIVASGGLVTWPREWLATVGAWLADDAARNADKAVSLPGVLARAGVPDLVGFAVGGLMALAAVPRLLRAPLPEAGAGALLVGVAASPHAWGYEAALLLPFVWWALAGGIAEPWRTRIVVLAYLLGPLWLLSHVTIVSGVAVVVLGAYVAWVGGLWRGDRGAA